MNTPVIRLSLRFSTLVWDNIMQALNFIVKGGLLGLPVVNNTPVNTSTPVVDSTPVDTSTKLVASPAFERSPLGTPLQASSPISTCPALKPKARVNKSDDTTREFRSQRVIDFDE